MDESTQQYYQLQNALSNQFQNLKGEAKTKYTDAVSHILNNYAEKKEAAMEIYEKAKDTAEKTSEALHNISSTIEGSTLGTTLFGKNVRKLVDKVKAKKAFLKNKAEKLMQDAKDKADDLKSRVDDTVDNVKNKAGDIQQDMQDKLTSVQENIENLESKTFDTPTMGDIYESKTDLEGIGSTFDSAKASTSGFEDLSSMGNELKGVGTSSLKNFGSKASDYLKNSSQNIQNKISNKAEEIVGKGKKLISRVKAIAEPKEAINPYQPKINQDEGIEMQAMGKSKPIEAPQTPQNEAQLTQLSKAEDVGQKVSSNIEDVTNNLKGTITQTSTDLEGIANKTAQTAEDAVESVQNVGSKISSIASKGLGGELGDLIPEIGEGLSEIGGEEVAELGAGAIGGPIGEGIALITGIGTAIGSVISTVESIKKHINDGQSQLTKQANASVQQLQKPHADLTGKYVAPNQSSIYNQTQHFSGF